MRPPRKWSAPGEGMQNFAVLRVADLRKLKWSTMIGREQPTFPVTVAMGGHVLGAGEGQADGRLQRHAVQLLHEVEVPVVAAEFTVGDGLQADRLLARDGLADGIVLYALQVGALCLAGGDELGWAEEAADVVGVIRRNGRSVHRPDFTKPIEARDARAGR